jgi:hypothetical protein
MEVRNPVVERDCPADQVKGELDPTLMVRDNAQHVQAVDVIGVVRKNLPIAALGLAELTGIVQLKRLFESAADVQHHCGLLEIIH